MSPTAADADVVLAGRVEAAARRRFGTAAVERLATLPGGHSGLTHLATLALPDGERRVVVKSTPPGRAPRGRHDVLRQARAIAAVHRLGGVPVPEVVFADDEPPPLFAMDYVAGSAGEPALEPPGPDETPARIAAAWTQAIDMLADLHALPVDALGLADERPRDRRDELRLWTDTLRAGGAADDPLALRVTEALAARAPATAPRPGLVHGDFRLGNVLWDDGRAAALVDWEIWSIGDPRSDLGWLCVFADGARFPGVGRTVPGAPSADEVAERYLARAGLGAADLDWFRALGELKIAAVAAHNLRRHAEGRYRDPHYERMAAGIEPHLEAAARRLGA